MQGTLLKKIEFICREMERCRLSRVVEVCRHTKVKVQSSSTKPVARTVSSDGTWLKAAERLIERDRTIRGQSLKYE